MFLLSHAPLGVRASMDMRLGADSEGRMGLISTMRTVEERKVDLEGSDGTRLEET